MIMKESDIKKKFDSASAAFDQRMTESYAKTYLEALRDAVKDLQEGGMNISLEVRLRTNGSPRQVRESPLANATTIADGYKLEWVVALTSYKKSQLGAFDDTGMVADFTSERSTWTGPWPAPATDGGVPLKDAIMNVIIYNLAQAKAAAAYSVPATGISGTLDKKPLAAPKLGGTQP